MSADTPVDPRAFRDFEHSGWEEVAKHYDHYFANLTTQAIGPLLDAAGARAGTRLLDVACGPGYVAEAAADRGAMVTGIDFLAAQIRLARERCPTIEFREGDAEALDYPAENFDAVVMNFGLLHVARAEQSLMEAIRVLRKGGRFAFTVWARPEEAVGLAIVLRAIATNGATDVPLPPGPPFFRFSDHDECRRALIAAGFVHPTAAQLPLFWRLPSPDALFAAAANGTVRTRGLLRAQSAEAFERIRTAVRDAASAYSRDGITEIPMPCVLASATKP